jgi:hypothetical protein
VTLEHVLVGTYVPHRLCILSGVCRRSRQEGECNDHKRVTAGVSYGADGGEWNEARLLGSVVAFTTERQRLTADDAAYYRRTGANPREWRVAHIFALAVAFAAAAELGHRPSAH